MAITVRSRIGLLMVLLALPIQSAAAQSSWQPIFGYGSSHRSDRYPGFFPYRPRSPYGDEEFQSPVRGGTYRTMCVRLCDGYYFPISSAVTQGAFAHDADACTASCGAEARLFYHPSTDGDVGEMVDLTGMAYSALPNAFRYRKTLVESCRCRPQPWSAAERERHRSYAAGQGPAAGPPRDADVIAGGDGPRSPDLPSPTPDALIVERPEPVARQVEPLPMRPFSGPDIPRSRYEWPGERRRY